MKTIHRTRGRRDLIREKSGFFLSGAVHPAVLVCLFFLFLSGIGYVYALNRTAVGGYAVRELEQEISELRKERKRLEIVAAERRSLARIEESAKGREMSVTGPLKVVEGRHALALRQ